jgi:Ca2+-binding EF-hand superfamily protein
MDKLKTENSKNNQASPPHKLKLTQEEILSQIPIKSIEKNCLDRVFKLLSSLQGEESSDEDSVAKIYKKQIETKANQKKMKIAVSNYVSKTSMQNTKKTSKGFKEDDEKAFSDVKGDEDHNRKGTGKVSVKAVRKILRTLCNEYPKEEMDSMVWEVDENLDGYVCENEFEKMYKRCITDEKEQQPKKLFYLVQFLMYDKEKKGYITEEDTLEILYIRHGDKFNEAIDAIFE